MKFILGIQGRHLIANRDANEKVYQNYLKIANISLDILSSVNGL